MNPQAFSGSLEGEESYAGDGIVTTPRDTTTPDQEPENTTHFTSQKAGNGLFLEDESSENEEDYRADSHPGAPLRNETFLREESGEFEAQGNFGGQNNNLEESSENPFEGNLEHKPIIPSMEDEDQTDMPAPMLSMAGHQKIPIAPTLDEDEEEEQDGDSEDGDSDDNDYIPLEGAYDPSEFQSLPVSTEIKDLFAYIGQYRSQNVEVEYTLRPFILDYIPAVGDIDAFIKIPRPDDVDDNLGLVVLDEPCAKQSDPTVLDLHLRATTKEGGGIPKETVVKQLDRADQKPKEIEQWIANISELHKSKPATSVHYTKPMPDIDSLMAEWPPEFEELLKRVELPTADMDMPLESYIDMICGILDIPVHKSRIQSLHVLFTLYSEFKNSQHFKALADENKLDNEESGGPNTDTLLL